jgi:hypothetical protein
VLGALALLLLFHDVLVVRPAAGGRTEHLRARGQHTIRSTIEALAKLRGYSPER